jgi:hypothetical protein
VPSLHEQVRDAVVSTLEIAFAASSPVVTVEVFGMTIPDTRRSGLPCVICSEGEEYEGGFGGTNVRDDWVYPVLVGLYTSDPVADPPGLVLTEFRQIVREQFHNRRLADVPEVMVCTVRGSGPLAADDVPAFRDLRSAFVVDCVARVARGL